jgi:hypothetical protein
MVRVHKRFFRLNWTALRVQYVDYVLLSVAITTQYSPRSLYTLCANLAGFDHEMGREKNEKRKKNISLTLLQHSIFNRSPVQTRYPTAPFLFPVLYRERQESCIIKASLDWSCYKDIRHRSHI